MKEQLDRSVLSNLSETVSHSISRLRPLTSNPDFDNMFTKLEDITLQLHNVYGELEILWERKGEMLDKVLQYKMFETDISKVSYSSFLFYNPHSYSIILMPILAHIMVARSI